MEIRSPRAHGRNYLTLLARENPDNHTAFIRRATSGSRILRQYECITYDSYGLKRNKPFSAWDSDHWCRYCDHPAGNQRHHSSCWNWDKPIPSNEWSSNGKGIDWRLSLLYRRSEKLHLKVYMGTLLPIFGWRTYATFRDDLRNEVNAWIRSTKEIDGCIDFDLALRGEDNPSAFREGFDSGDHLHPSQ